MAASRASWLPLGPGAVGLSVLNEVGGLKVAADKVQEGGLQFPALFDAGNNGESACGAGGYRASDMPPGPGRQAIKGQGWPSVFMVCSEKEGGRRRQPTAPPKCRFHGGG